jgi:tRNA A37 threonylcarbamoyladenosine dehydratase
MEDFFSRSEALLGTEAMQALQSTRVILFGVGGVGSWCAEALIRTGLVHLTIVDDDVVQPSNLNRQLPATRDTLGRPKVEALRERLLSINPDADITALQARYTAENPALSEAVFLLSTFDYIIDAIDDVSAKTDLLLRASRVKGAKVFSSMGAAFRLDPTQVRVAEFWDVKGDALARALRERMKKAGLKPAKKIRCVYSLEPALQIPNHKSQISNLKFEIINHKSKISNHKSEISNQKSEISNHKFEPLKGSLMPVTAVFGCTLAALVLNDLRK